MAGKELAWASLDSRSVFRTEWLQSAVKSVQVENNGGAVRISVGMKRLYKYAWDALTVAATEIIEQLTNARDVVLVPLEIEPDKAVAWALWNCRRLAAVEAACTSYECMITVGFNASVIFELEHVIYDLVDYTSTLTRER